MPISTNSEDAATTVIASASGNQIGKPAAVAVAPYDTPTSPTVSAVTTMPRRRSVANVRQAEPMFATMNRIQPFVKPNTSPLERTWPKPVARRQPWSPKVSAVSVNVLGATLSELARRAGIGKSTLSELESGRWQPELGDTVGACGRARHPGLATTRSAEVADQSHPRRRRSDPGQRHLGVPRQLAQHFADQRPTRHLPDGRRAGRGAPVRSAYARNRRARGAQQRTGPGRPGPGAGDAPVGRLHQLSRAISRTLSAPWSREPPLS